MARFGLKLSILLNCFCFIALTEYDVIVVPEGVSILTENVGNKATIRFLKEHSRNEQRNIETPSELDILEMNDEYDIHEPVKQRVRVENGRTMTRALTLQDIDTDKIIGGYTVEINDYPYHASYGKNCAGTIIHEKWVITAGHCGSKPYVKFGSKFYNQGTRIDVKDHFIHPGWSKKQKDHPFDFDFQLLLLESEISFNKNVQPVKLGRVEDMNIGVVLTVTGWGFINEEGPYSDDLRAVKVPIVSKSECQKVDFPYYRGQLTQRMFCAGYWGGEKDACQGDSGGPAVSDGRLLGIISFGYGCATPRSYGVYSKISAVRSWIEKTTELKFD